jgi:glycosyltransferase involved in cell wall biosynthesis
LWPLADHLLVNAFAIRKHLVEHLRLPERRITVIPNGVDTTFFRPPVGGLNCRKKIVLCIARLVPDKDHGTLLKAFGILARRHPDAELWVVGNGGLETVLKERAARTIPEGSVRFFPGRLDVRSLFHQAALFVLSSRQESLPNVVLEAMASGLPIVATAVGGLSEVVQHGRTGLLVPGQDAAALAQAMGNLLLDETVRAAYGKAGRRRVQADYSMAAMVRRHEEVLLDLLKCRR